MPKILANFPAFFDGVDSTLCISKLHRFGFSHVSLTGLFVLYIIFSIRRNLLNVRIRFYLSRLSRRIWKPQKLQVLVALLYGLCNTFPRFLCFPQCFSCDAIGSSRFLLIFFCRFFFIFLVLGGIAFLIISSFVLLSGAIFLDL